MRIWKAAGSQEELIRLPAGPNGPFGEDPAPWYKRRRTPGAPKGQVLAAGAVGAPLSSWAASGLHGPGRIAVAFLVLVAPTWALETWHKQRRRQREDRLLPQLEHER